MPNPDLIEELVGQLRLISSRLGQAVLFYAEAGDNWSGGSIFYPKGDRIQFEGPSNTIFNLVEDLWFVAPTNKKWRGITMFIEGDEFRTNFDYGEGWSEVERESDRRIPIAQAHFGDKPIYYPPLESAEPWE